MCRFLSGDGCDTEINKMIKCSGGVGNGEERRIAARLSNDKWLVVHIPRALGLCLLTNMAAAFMRDYMAVSPQ